MTPFRALLLLLAVTGCDQAPSVSAPPASAPVRQRFETYGFDVIPPAGWKEVGRTSKSAVVEWISPDSTEQDVKASITIEAGPSHGKSVDDTADTVQRAIGGTLEPLSLAVGELRARRIVEPPPLGATDGNKLQHVVATHATLAYLIGDGIKVKRASPAEVEAVATSIRWLPIESPSAHLDLLQSPTRLKIGPIQMKYSRGMYIVQNDVQSFQAALKDPVRNYQPFSFSAAIVPLTGPVADARQQLADKMASEKKITPKIEWETRAGRRIEPSARSLPPRCREWSPPPKRCGSQRCP